MLALLAILATLSYASAGVFTEDATQQKVMWENFKATHKKSYETMEEETRRFGHFLENLKMADIRNAQELKQGGSAVHGVTIFSDLSQSEFEARYLTADLRMKSKDRNYEKIVRAVDTNAGLVDWTGTFTTPVKDQGYCGSCWAFSATAQIESDAIRTLGYATTLSPEQITQCDTTSYGCSGGWTENAYNYVKGAGGIATDASYPYTSYYGVTGTCTASQKAKVIQVNGYSTIYGESQMASYVQSIGPLSVCVDANNWNSYTGGILSSCGQSVDHCVQVVGVDVGGGYWKVRNSWNTNWGEAGHIRLSYGQNTCAITTDPTYVSVSRV